MKLLFTTTVAFVSLQLAVCRGDGDWRDVIPGPDLFLDATNLSILISEDDPGSDTTRWRDFGFINMMFLECGDSTEFAFTFKDDKMVLSFRTTDDFTDWEANLDAAFTDYNPPFTKTVPDGDEGSVVLGQVHRGIHNKLFGNDYMMNVAKDIFRTLPEFFDEGYELLVVGHSQGAAMATLYGVWIAQVMPKMKVTVLGIGSPRVADVQFQESVRSLTNLAIFRLVNEEDVVARAPFTSMGFRDLGHLLYKFEHDDHTIKAYYLQTGQGKYDGVDSYEWDIDVDIFHPKDSVADHSYFSYLDIIETAVADSSYWPTSFQTRSEPQCCRKLFGKCWRWC